ncbi:MAG TPA: ScpA family protein [Methanoregula sp.]|nr:ScpA family protein [Methanoregula sp.]
MADPYENKPGNNPPDICPHERVTPRLENSPEPDPSGAPEDSSLVSESPESTLSGVIEDPVEILVGLAERGEIDPWNINIIEVTDRFLSELERCRQLNLQVSGRTLFYAATLLRMKSEHLELLSDPAEEGLDDDEESYGEDYALALDSETDYHGRLGPIELLEHEIQRRLDRKNLRKSPVTLFELIIELKNIEKEERRRRRLTDTGDDLLVYADDVVNIAHDEGYQESAMTVLEECLDCIELEEELTLVQLCQKLEWGIPEVYIPLLFLALEGRCSLRQEEFFGDIFVQICRADN